MQFVLKNCFMLFILLFFGCKPNPKKSDIQNEKHIEFKYDTLNFPSMRYYNRIKNLEKRNKPILLFLNAFGSPNSRRMEVYLRDSIGMDKVKSAFNFINLYMDDRTLMDEKDWFEKRGKIRKRIGDENIRVQTEKTGTGSQPILVIMSGDSIIEKQYYSTELEEISNFLFR